MNILISERISWLGRVILFDWNEKEMVLFPHSWGTAANRRGIGDDSSLVWRGYKGMGGGVMSSFGP